MGHQSNVKLLRKQVRNVAQETLPSVLENEAVQALEKRVMEVVGTRLDQIAENVQAQIKVMDGQNQEFRRLLMQDAGFQISREMTNIAVTSLAWQEVLVGKLNLENVDTFSAEIEAKKTEIFARLEAEAKAKEAEQAKATAEAAAAAPPVTGIGTEVEGGSNE